MQVLFFCVFQRHINLTLTNHTLSLTILDNLTYFNVKKFLFFFTLCRLCSYKLLKLSKDCNMASIDKIKSQIPIKYQKQYIKAVNGELSPRQAIKINCLECVGWRRSEVTLCTDKTCPLYKYRPLQKKAANR